MPKRVTSVFDQFHSFIHTYVNKSKFRVKIEKIHEYKKWFRDI